MSRKEKARRIVASESDGVCETYSNSFSATWTHNDVRLAFGQNLPLEGPRSILVDGVLTKRPGEGDLQHAVEDRAAITLCWANAKKLQEMLALILAAHERVNGEIKTPVLATVEAVVTGEPGSMGGKNVPN